MKRVILIALASAAIGALITFAILHKAEPDEEQPKSEQQRIAIENGEPTITLDDATQKKIGIVTTRLGSQTTNRTVETFGSVVDVKDLTDLVNQSAAANAQAQQARSKASFDSPVRSTMRLRFCGLARSAIVASMWSLNANRSILPSDSH